MKNKWIWALAGVLALHLPSEAQNIEDVLRQISQNNKELQAWKQDTEAAKLEVRSRNNLEDPTVEYSPFYAKGTSGKVSSELVVSQGFDFPTLYAARHKAGKLQQTAIDKQYVARRREILLAAKELCFDLIRLNQQRSLLDERSKNADQLLTLFNERLAEGDANIFEVNKIKMERMSVQTEVAKNNAEHRAAIQQLLAMNDNHPIDFSANTYPQTEAIPSYDALYDEVMASDAAVQASDAAVQAAQKEVSVSKQNWLPKLTVGYRRNTDLSDKSNGFLVGGSLPLFSNRKKSQIVRAQALSAQYRLDDVKLQAEANTQSLYNELKQLQEAMNAYDLPLMSNTLSALKDAVTEGQLSVIDYYTEAANVYQNIEAYHEVENRYQKVLAEIYKFRL